MIVRAPLAGSTSAGGQPGNAGRQKARSKPRRPPQPIRIPGGGTMNGLVNANIVVRGPKFGEIVRSEYGFGEIVRSPYGDLTAVPLVDDTLSPATIAIYSAGGILLLGLGVYAFTRKRHS